MPRISIIVLDFMMNSNSNLQSLLNSLENEEYELLIATKQKEHIQQFEKVKIVKELNQEKIGVQLNELIELASGELLLKVHSDVLLKSEESEKKISSFLKNAPKNIGILAPKQLRPDGFIYSCGNWVIHPKGYHPIGYRMPKNMLFQPFECDVPSDAFLVFKREVFEQVGGLDANLHGFDLTVDFEFKARMKGYRILGFPQVEYVHNYTGENPQPFSELTELTEASDSSFYSKWGFDYLHPDLDVVMERYKGTNLLWNIRWLSTPQYDKYERMGALHWDWFKKKKPREIDRVNFVTSLVDKERCYKILDLGCGDGLYAHFWALDGHQVIGVDNNTEGIRWSIKKSSEYDYPNSPPTFRLADCYELPFEDNSFDYVFCLDLIEHLSNPIKMLREVWRVLDEGGFLFIMTPRKQLHVRHDPAYHVVEYEMHELDSLVRSVFKNCQTQPWFGSDLFCIAWKGNTFVLE